MNDITQSLLKAVTGQSGRFTGAYNIREDSGCAGRQSSDHVKIEPKTDKPGIDIKVSSAARQEQVLIPACVTHTGVDDLVYNDFYIEEGADITVIAGCGVHAEDGGEARHNGIHHFFVGKNARVHYKEKHIGTGTAAAIRRIDPVTDIFLEDGAFFEMDSVQIGGVDTTDRKTSAILGAGAKLIIRERIMTEGNQQARTEFTVELNGKDAAADVVSRSVAKDESYQSFYSRMNGNNRCSGHSECDAILAGNGKVLAEPALYAGNLDAELIHEAAIGKIAGEQIVKLRTFGLTEEEAEQKIIHGFLKD